MIDDWYLLLLFLAWVRLYNYLCHNSNVRILFLCLYLIRIDLSTTVLVVNTKLRTQYTVLEGKREVNLEKLFCSFPNAYCLLVNNNLFVINNESIQYRISPVIPVQSGPVQFTWYYTFAEHQVLWPADYLVLSGALGKPCTSVIIYS
jgi:hypothetical protein